MGKGTRLLTSALLLVACGCSVRQLEPSKSLSGQTTIFGCLERTQPDGFVLTDAAGTRTPVTGNPDLQRHADHAVRVVGMLNREGAAGLKAIRVDFIASSCQPELLSSR